MILMNLINVVLILVMIPLFKEVAFGTSTKYLSLGFFKLIYFLF